LANAMSVANQQISSTTVQIKIAMNSSCYASNAMLSNLI